jgi:hypothetical protein
MPRLERSTGAAFFTRVFSIRSRFFCKEPDFGGKDTTMKKPILLMTLLAVMFSACAPAAEPVPTVDTQATIEALALEIVAGTLTAMPTETPLPTETSTPTETPLPTETPTETPTLEPTITPTLPVFYGEFTPAGLPTGVNRGYLLFQNDSKINPIYLNFQGTTDQGERPYYYKWTFEGRQHRWDIPFGTYNYVIYVGDRRVHSGTVRINNSDKTTFFIREENKLNIAGP